MAESIPGVVSRLSAVDGIPEVAWELTKPLSPETRGPLYPDDAACKTVGLELFYAEKGDAELTRLAKRVCAGCEVKAECLEEAMANHEAHGVWGGLTPRERYRLKRGVA